MQGSNKDITNKFDLIEEFYLEQKEDKTFEEALEKVEAPSVVTMGNTKIFDNDFTDVDKINARKKYIAGLGDSVHKIINDYAQFIEEKYDQANVSVVSNQERFEEKIEEYRVKVDREFAYKQEQFKRSMEEYKERLDASFTKKVKDMNQRIQDRYDEKFLELRDIEVQVSKLQKEADAASKVVKEKELELAERESNIDEKERYYDAKVSQMFNAEMKRLRNKELELEKREALVRKQVKEVSAKKAALDIYSKKIVMKEERLEKQEEFLNSDQTPVRRKGPTNSADM